MMLTQRVAVITGAGSGIGRATALSLARRGCRPGRSPIRPANSRCAAFPSAAPRARRHQRGCFGRASGWRGHVDRDERAHSPNAPPGEVERGRKLTQKLLRMPPERAGEIIVRGIERRQPRILVGSDAKFVALLERLAPVGYWNLLKKAIQR